MVDLFIIFIDKYNRYIFLCVCVCYFIDLSFLIKRLDLESLEAVSGTKLTVSLHSLPVDSNSIPNPYLSLTIQFLF